MKLWILLVVFLLGSFTYEVRCQSGASEVHFGDDDEDDIDVGDDDDVDDDDDDDDDDDVDDDDDDDDDDKYPSSDEFEIICDRFNLQLCIQDFELEYENYDSTFSAWSRDDPLCWESYAATDCMHSFAKECFPDTEGKEDFLCKLNDFKDRITVLCLNETYYEEPSDEEILKCLEGAEVDAEECVEQTIPQIADMIRENNIQIDRSNIETSQDAIKCLVMGKVLECTVNRLEDRCPEEVVEGFVEGAEEALSEIMGNKCEEKTITNVVSIK